MHSITKTIDLRKYLLRYYKSKDYYISIQKQDRSRHKNIIYSIILYKMRQSIPNAMVFYDMHNIFYIQEELYNQLDSRVETEVFISTDYASKQIALIQHKSRPIHIKDFIYAIISRADIINEFLETEKGS